jgi:hypothetical protein
VIQFVHDSDRDLFENAIQFAQKQVRKVIEKYPDFYPMYTEGGSWQHEGAAWTHWCDGFFPGMMWIFYRHLGPDKPDSRFWYEQAIRYSKPLEPRKMDAEVHDLGFIFLSTYYRWYQFTRDLAIKDVVLQAGKTLAQRFNEDGQYLRSFVAEESLFIDVMMNVGIIFYAARETNDKRLRDVAVRATAPPRTRESSTCRPASSSDNPPNRAFVETLAGRAASGGRFTGSQRHMNTAAIRGSSKPPRTAPTTTSRTRRAMEFRPGTTMPRPKIACWWTHRPLQSPLPGCSACAG